MSSHICVVGITTFMKKRWLETKGMSINSYTGVTMNPISVDESGNSGGDLCNLE